MPNPKYEFIDQQLMDRIASEARLSPRLRMNYNFHRSVDEPVNRLLNVMHRGSYLPVHRHLNPSRSESGVVVRGLIGLSIYDDDGNVVERHCVGPQGECVGFDIEPGLWHGLVVLEDDTVIYEVKQGPYAPLTPDNVASWSPDEGDKQSVAAFIRELESSFQSDK